MATGHFLRATPEKALGSSASPDATAAFVAELGANTGTWRLRHESSGGYLRIVERDRVDCQGSGGPWTEFEVGFRPFCCGVLGLRWPHTSPVLAVAVWGDLQAMPTDIAPGVIGLKFAQTDRMVQATRGGSTWATFLWSPAAVLDESLAFLVLEA
jgi:hypothetical protein